MANTYVQVGTYSSWNLNASGDVVELEFTAGASDIGLILGGTFVATVQFEIGLIDAATGITWTSLTCNPVPSGDGATSATAPGTWSAVVAGFTHFRFRCSAYTSGRIYATVNAVLAANEAISGNPTAGQLAAFSNGAQISGVRNSSVDPSTGDVTLGAGLTVNTTRAINLISSHDDLTIQQTHANGDGMFILSNGPMSIEAINEILISTLGPDIAPGDGAVEIASGGGVSITDNSLEGIFFNETGAGAQITFTLTDPGSTFGVNASGAIVLSAAGGLGLGGSISTFGLDTPTPGVATLSTIFNAVGGYQANGTPGISGSGTTMTNVTVVNGIITAATFT